MPDEQSRVSVIVPVRNGERFLGQALQSIVEQELAPWEIIVVDGHSTDRTAQIAASFPGVVVIAQTGRGVPDAYNQGITHACGAWIAFLESDDLWTRDKLRRQIDHLARNPRLQFTLTKARLFLEPGSELPRGYKLEWLAEDQTGCLLSTFVGRRSVFDQVGLFDSSYTIAGDMDWFARAKDSGVPMEFLAETLLHKRIHNDNLTSQTRVNNDELLHVMRQTIVRQRGGNPITSAAIQA